MKNKILAAVLLAAMLFALAACGAQETETGSVEPEVQETEAPLKLIGKETQGESVRHLKITNLTGQDITGFAVTFGEAAENENLLPGGETFANGETRVLWYDTEAAVKALEAEAKADDPVTTPEYKVVLTLKDGTTQELHAFPMDDAEACEIRLQEDLAYLVYTSVSTKENVNTHDAEQAARDLAAEQAAAEEEAARQQAAAEEAARQQAAAAEAARQAQQQQQSQPAPADEPDDGCVDDGLTWD